MASPTPLSCEWALAPLVLPGSTFSSAWHTLSTCCSVMDGNIGTERTRDAIISVTQRVKTVVVLETASHTPVYLVNVSA